MADRNGLKYLCLSASQLSQFDFVLPRDTTHISARDHLVMPWLGTYDGSTADSDALLRDDMPGFLTVVNVGDLSMTIQGPQRPRRIADRHSGTQPDLPPPSPPIGTLAPSEVRGASWVSLAWTGKLWHDYDVVVCSPHFVYAKPVGPHYPDGYWRLDIDGTGSDQIRRWAAVQHA